MSKEELLLKDLVRDLVANINSLLRQVRGIKSEHRVLIFDYYFQSPGSILNAYREGDISFYDAVEAINNLKGKVIKRKDAIVGVEKYYPNEPCPRCGSTSKAWDGLSEPTKWVCGRCRYAFWEELRHCDEVKK